MLGVQYIIGHLNSPVEQIMSFIYQWQDVSINLYLMNEIRIQKNEENKNRIINMITKNYTIYIENLYFKYTEDSPNWVLSNNSFEVPQGKVIATAGASGSGKTTLVKLLLGYYTPNKKTDINTTNLEQINLTW